jgi:uroporphyrin-III C-methyltransferase/precorrin-2 dehydrogenase/sirohydrochlorin ferrochelatase
MFPVTLCLERVRCLVVGGGEVALRKVEGLLRERANVTVVAPEAVAELRRLATAGAVTWERRPYAGGEAGKYRLVFAATDQRQVNRGIRDDAEAAGTWVNVADDPELCTFHLPARLERGPLQIAISSGGGAPFVVRRLREVLDRWLDPAWSAWAGAAARFRGMARESGAGTEQREQLFDGFFGATVDATRLRVRVPGDAELARWITGGPAGGGRNAGFVSLVGAGPGNGGLLTLRGYRRLHAADAVVYDRLAEPALPCDLPEGIQLHAVGKEAGSHPVPQDEINAMLVALAREGKRVVRFKGGDPYVFGRGGEEALALRAAGIAFEVVPGVSTGVAGPAFAGVPVTQRGISSQVTYFTAHKAVTEGEGDESTLLAPPARHTLVGFMGVGNLAAVTRALLRKGVPAATPALLVERATTAFQRSIPATVGTLAAVAESEVVRAPALLVVGEAVGLAAELGWHERLPLARTRVALAAPAVALAEALELRGAEVLEAPLPLTVGARLALSALPLTGWVARTPAEVTFFCDGLSAVEGAARAIAVCAGGDTATAARNGGWPAVHEIDAACDPADVARALGGE